MANNFKHRYKSSVTTESETLNSIEQEFVADGHRKLDPTIPASSTNFAVTLAFTLAKVKSLWFYSDKAVTLKTNSSGSPVDTIVLAAGIPLVWNANLGANPFSADVTSLFVTNAAVSAAEMKIRILHDDTPST